MPGALPSDSIDLIVTSPPYNFGHRYAHDESHDTHDWNEYFRTLSGIWSECYRVLMPGGRIAVNIQPLISDFIPIHHIISGRLLQTGFLWKAGILREKNNCNARYTAFGSWKSPSMPYLRYTWEFIGVFDKFNHKKTGNTSDIDITDTEFKEWVYGKWTFPPEIRMKEYNHPAMFPEELPRRLIKLFSYRGDIVPDPFNGAGTRDLRGRNAWQAVHQYRYISPEYCDIALRRVLQSSEKIPAGNPPGKRPYLVTCPYT